VAIREIKTTTESYDYRKYEKDREEMTEADSEADENNEIISRKQNDDSENDQELNEDEDYDTKKVVPVGKSSIQLNRAEGLTGLMNRCCEEGCRIVEIEPFCKDVVQID